VIRFDGLSYIRTRSLKTRLGRLRTRFELYGGCAWGTFGCAGFVCDRSVNPCTAATHSFDGECWQISPHIRKSPIMKDQTNLAAYQSLPRASQLLDTASVLAAETSDANQQLCRALNQAVALLTETSRTLVEDSLLEMKLRFQVNA
jgi:hypothetical protein